MADSSQSKHAVFLAQRLQHQRKNGEHCDVCICIHDSRHLAHKCVLAANSPKLSKLIEEASEQQPETRAIEVELSQIDTMGFTHILEYFYTGVLDLNQDNIIPVITAANELGLKDVVSQCSDVFQLSLQPQEEDAVKDKDSQSFVNLPNVSSNSDTNISGENKKEKPNIILNDGIEEQKVDSLQNILYSQQQPTAGLIAQENNLIDVQSTQLSSLQNYTEEKKQDSKLISVQSDEDKQQLPQQTQLGYIGGEVNSKDCQQMMEQVHQLRMQHQHLQVLQAQQQHQADTHYQGENGEPGKKKRKRISEGGYIYQNSPSGVNSTDYNQMNLLPVQNTTTSANLQVYNTMSTPQTQSRMVGQPQDFRVVTDEVRAALYNKYESFKNDPLVSSTCDVQELLQRGKARHRKTTEQNCLNTSIRSVLDTIQITDSTDPRVEDALILIMDKFETLRAHINNQEIRRALRIKIRHSIHCKKWRIKKKQMSEQSLNQAAAEHNNNNNNQHIQVANHQPSFVTVSSTSPSQPIYQQQVPVTNDIQQQAPVIVMNNQEVENDDAQSVH